MPARSTRRSVDLGGTIAVVTGAGRGIGRVTAVALAQRGARVVVADLDADSAAATAELCGGSAAGAVSAGVDVNDRDGVFALADQVEQEHGPVRVLVNNAGVGMTGRFLDVTPEDWDWILGVNVHGVVHCTAAFAPAMVRRGEGSVVNIASCLAYTFPPTEPAYAASKAAVLALSQSLRADWAPQGVSVSAICPGVIQTELLADMPYRSGKSPDRPHWGRRLVRGGHPPETVARAVLRAIDTNRVMVTVGPEAALLWAMHRLLPLAVNERVARLTARR